MKLNHVLVRTTNLDALSQLFTEVIGLETGDRPPFPFAGAWFYSEGHPLIHVVEDRNGKLGDTGPIAHVALTGADYERLIKNLNSKQVPYHENDAPLSGERQVFVSGPDGLMVEMMFPNGTGADRPKPYAGES